MFCEILVTDVTNISREILVYMKVTNISQTNISCSSTIIILLFCKGIGSQFHNVY